VCWVQSDTQGDEIFEFRFASIFFINPLAAIYILKVNILLILSII
jgi:hypothetical protein